MKAKQTSEPKRGKPVNCWLHAEDEAKLTKLRSALAAHGHFASQSQVLRLALHLAKPDAVFIAAYEKVEAADGRRNR